MDELYIGGNAVFSAELLENYDETFSQSLNSGELKNYSFLPPLGAPRKFIVIDGELRVLEEDSPEGLLEFPSDAGIIS